MSFFVSHSGGFAALCYRAVIACSITIFFCGRALHQITHELFVK